MEIITFSSSPDCLIWSFKPTDNAVCSFNFTFNQLVFKTFTKWSAELVKGKTKGGERLQDAIRSCLTSLDACTEFWKQEKPVCARERERERRLTQQKVYKPRRSPPFEPAQSLLKSLDDIDAGKTGIWFNLWFASFLFSLKNADCFDCLSS